MINFPYIAFVLGSFLMLVVVKGSEVSNEGSTLIPLLTLLFISEFATIVTLVGAVIGMKNIRSVGIKPAYMTITILCILISVGFIVLGINLWPT